MEGLKERPSLGSDLRSSIGFRPFLTGDRACGACNVDALILDDRVGHNDRLALGPPCAELDNHKRYVRRQSLERWTVSTARRFHDEDGYVVAIWISDSVAGPVVEDSEAMGRVYLTELYFN